MSYSVRNYKKNEEVEDALVESLTNYLKFEDTTIYGTGDSPDATASIAKIKFSLLFGDFNQNTYLYFNIPDETSKADQDFAHLSCSFYDYDYDNDKYSSTIFDHADFKPENMRTDGLDLYTVTNGVSRFVAFNDIKNGLMFDTFYSMDDSSKTMKVLIAQMPRYASTDHNPESYCYGFTNEDTKYIDFPKVFISGSSPANDYETRVVQLYDPLSQPKTSNSDYHTTLKETMITSDEQQVVDAPNFGFTNSLYVTPFTYRGYISKSLFVVDGGHSLPPYGHIRLGNFSYVRVTSNIIMRVGED